MKKLLKILSGDKNRRSVFKVCSKVSDGQIQLYNYHEEKRNQKKKSGTSLKHLITILGSDAMR